MAEVVLASPQNGLGSRPSTRVRAQGTNTERPFTSFITSGREYVASPFDSEKVPVALAPQIHRFLLVANHIAMDEPRAAYFCRVHAFALTHNLDRNSRGHGVRQFKTALLQRLQQDEEVMKGEKSELLPELRRVYSQYNDYIIKHGGELTPANGEKLIKVQDIASVLLEVLNALTSTERSETLPDSDLSRSRLDVSNNTLPSGQEGAHMAAIRQLPEWTAQTKSAIGGVQNVQGLPVIETSGKQVPPMDFFDWVQLCLRFQREHLIRLVANLHVRRKQQRAPKLIGAAVDALMKRALKNSSHRRELLGRKSSIR